MYVAFSSIKVSQNYEVLLKRVRFWQHITQMHRKTFPDVKFL